MPEKIYKLMSGEARGMLPGLSRGALRIASWGYGAAVRARNLGYDRGWLESHQVDIPVVCVGNITTGGTGKTPMVAWIARWIRNAGSRVAIVSRGYGAGASGVNDEALELEQRLPDVPHLQNADRVAAVRVALEELDMQCVVLDDGFQHRRLKRDLNVILLDATNPFGFDALLPRGLMREPLSGLARADVLVLSRADAVTPEQRAELRDKLTTRYGKPWVEVGHRPTGWQSSSGTQHSLTQFTGQPVLAFCGIGNPQGFRHTLSECGVQPQQWVTFPDHHQYARSDLDQLVAQAKQAGCQALLCTAKDLVKIRADRLDNLPLVALSIDLEIMEGQQVIEQQLRRLIAKAD